MKINATLVKEDGFCYGMVMPEKPDWSDYHADIQLAQKDAYNAALQATKDAAVRYEDQEAATEFCRSVRAIVVGESMVYPLPEPLEVGQIWQRKPNGGDWENCLESEAKQHHTVRRVLCISQGTDNQHTIEPEILYSPIETAYRQSMAQPGCDGAHGYTEGSNPTLTIDERLEYLELEKKIKSYEGGQSPPAAKLKRLMELELKMSRSWKVGVEEKKEPEYILDGVSVFPDRAEMTEDTKTRLTLLVATYNPSIKKIETYAGRPIKIVGVSEREEPTQEELWVEFWRQYHSVEYASNTQIRLSQKWKIQKI